MVIKNDCDKMWLSYFQGFTHHVAWEHNMWAYVFYLLHLKETNDNDCGAVDYYVLKLVGN